MRRRREGEERRREEGERRRWSYLTSVETKIVLATIDVLISTPE